MPVFVGRGRHGFKLSDEWVEHVASNPDNELRAHQIAFTHSYIALHLDELIHGEPQRQRSVDETAANANWFNFATWANVTVTRVTRGDRGTPDLSAGLVAPVRRRLTPAVLQARASQGQRVGRALWWGQRLIFVATCLTLLEFAEQIDKTGGSPGCFRAVDPKNCARANKITELAAASGPGSFTTDRHFRPMWRAFELYELARQAEDDTIKARLMLGGNLLLTAVEQDLIDPALEIIVDYIPNRLAGAVDWQVARVAERMRGVPPQLAYTVLRSRHKGVRRGLDAVWSRLMTDQVLVMELPTETLRLGRDIPARHRQWPYFPPDLRNLDDDIGDAVDDDTADALLEVARHVDSIDRTAGDGRGSAARDWRRWDERMNWALTLLRSRQQDETLFWRPYSEADEQRIIAGELPLRSGDPSELETPIGLFDALPVPTPQEHP